MFASIVDRVSTWAALPEGRAEAQTTQPLEVGRAYRLTAWPSLPQEMRSVQLLRVLSVMSHRPVSVAWVQRQLGCTREEATVLLDGLVAGGWARAEGVVPVAVAQRTGPRR